MTYTEPGGQTLTFPNNAALVAHLEKEVRQELVTELRKKVGSEPDAVEKLLTAHEMLEAKAVAKSVPKKRAKISGLSTTPQAP